MKHCHSASLVAILDAPSGCWRGVLCLRNRLQHQPGSIKILTASTPCFGTKAEGSARHARSYVQLMDRELSREADLSGGWFELDNKDAPLDAHAPTDTISTISTVSAISAVRYITKQHIIIGGVNLLVVE